MAERLYGRGSQMFGYQGLVSWKTIFPMMGGWFQGDSHKQHAT